MLRQSDRTGPPPLVRVSPEYLDASVPRLAPGLPALAVVALAQSEQVVVSLKTQRGQPLDPLVAVIQRELQPIVLDEMERLIELINARSESLESDV